MMPKAIAFICPDNKEEMPNMKWLPSILAAVVSLLGVFAEPLQAWVSAHPAIAVALAGVASIAAHLIKSPTQS